MCSPFHLAFMLLNNLCKLQIRSRQISISDLQKKLESAVTFFFFSRNSQNHSRRAFPGGILATHSHAQCCPAGPPGPLGAGQRSLSCWRVSGPPLSPVPLPRSTAFSSYKCTLPVGSVFTTRYTSCRGFSSPAAPDWTTSLPKYFPSSLW